jgi:hypothetical protein
LTWSDINFFRDVCWECIDGRVDLGFAVVEDHRTAACVLSDYNIASVCFFLGFVLSLDFLNCIQVPTMEERLELQTNVP